jgi:NADPH:quinone reductase-like Zn-dependent oxidoreductase
MKRAPELRKFSEDHHHGLVHARQLRALMLSPFVDQKLGTFVSKENHEDMIVLKELIEAGKVTPVIDRTYPLNEVPEAIRYMREGRARGKVVITVGVQV